MGKNMEILIVLIIIYLVVKLSPLVNLWYKRHRCPGCGNWHCLNYVSEIVTDKVIGHDHRNYGTGVGGHDQKYLGGLFGSRMSDQPFIRCWVEERYICRKCGCKISVHTRKDKR